MAAIRQTVRERYLNFLDDWHAGERHLPYTIIAVLAILALGSVLVPMTLSAHEPALPDSRRELLAQRYVEAVGKVRGARTPAPTVEQAMRRFGVSGGKSCSEPIPALHEGLVVQPKPVGGVRRASYVPPAALEQLRVAMRVYCPARDARYAAWLQRRG